MKNCFYFQFMQHHILWNDDGLEFSFHQQYRYIQSFITTYKNTRLFPFFLMTLFRYRSIQIYILKCIYMLLLRFIRDINIYISFLYFFLSLNIIVYSICCCLFLFYDDFFIALNSFIPNLRACPYTKFPEF